MVELDYVFDEVNVGWLVTSQSMGARMWLEEHVGDDAVWYGAALFVKKEDGYILARELRDTDGYAVDFPWEDYEGEEKVDEEAL